MNTIQINRKKKGISPIIATLLLILIAIAAGVVVYAYVIGFVGNSTTNAGGSTDTLSIDQLYLSHVTTNVPVTAYVRNEGPSAENYNTGFLLEAEQSELDSWSCSYCPSNLGWYDSFSDDSKGSLSLYFGNISSGSSYIERCVYLEPHRPLRFKSTVLVEQQEI